MDPASRSADPSVPPTVLPAAGRRLGRVLRARARAARRLSSPAALAIVALSLGALGAAGGLAGCASAVPQAIRTPEPTPIAVAQVRQTPERYTGRTVRWGGTIVDVTNRENVTEIEVLARPLGRDGEPRTGARGQGRFIARIPGFVDPAEYPDGRSLTVNGPLLGVETRPVGEYPYRYPVVRADSRWLWAEPPPRVYYPYGHWGSPWYDPWFAPFPGYPYGPFGRPWYYW